MRDATMFDRLHPKPLTSMMDNVLAWRMGEAARETMKAPGGEAIDTGLILLRLLNEAGFDVVTRPNPLSKEKRG